MPGGRGCNEISEYIILKAKVWYSQTSPRWILPFLSWTFQVQSTQQGRDALLVGCQETIHLARMRNGSVAEQVFTKDYFQIGNFDHPKPVTIILIVLNSPWLPGYRWYVTCSYHYPYLFIPWCPVCTCRCLQISQGLWTSRMYYITIYIIYILYTKPMAVKKSLTRPIWLSPGIIASHGLVSALGPLTMS